MSRAPASRSILLESLVNHVALPPRLPGKEDNNLEQIQSALTGYLIDASRTLRDHTNGEFSRQWESVRTILHTCKILNTGGKLNKTSLVTHFRNLDRKDHLILHIAEQNAGLLIQRQHDVDGDTVTFEAFEGSPLSENVLAAEKALQWDFPGCAVAIPYSVFEDASFQNELAAFLEQASTESVKRFAARTQKAGSFAFESRDTVDPALITQMLMTMLEANGHRVFPTLLRKRVRDDVCWTDGAERPWRRCPYWLVLRVGLERHLCRLHGGEAGKAHYKFLLCLALAGLVEDALEHLSPEILALLNAKLTRRIVKLEVDKDRVSSDTRCIYETLLNSVRPLLRKTTNRTKQRVEGQWNRFKESIRRRTPRLQHYAEEGDLKLTLPNSGPYLHRVLSYRCMGGAPAMSRSYQLPSEFDVSAAMSSHFKAFAGHYYSLSDIEVGVEESLSSQSGLIMNPKKGCIELAAKINAYINHVGGAYDGNPEQKSVMLLTVMELWMSMDQAATKIFGLLREYSPGIPPEILEVLQLTSLTALNRLQLIEEYLRDRHTKCNFSRRTIFDDPVKGCFSDRYFQESPDSQMLQKLQQDIEEWAEAARQRKEKEWQHLSSEFEDLERSIAQATCLYTNEDFTVVHDDKHCRKCYLQRKARRMEIVIHEHPLPSDPVQANAVLFELRCPKAFAAYRNSTWKILGSLACQKPVQAVEPRLMVSDYSGLSAFVQSTSDGISLGSTTKSFRRTHYKSVRFPAALEDVCLTNGLKWGYFDTATKAWPGRQAEKPTFAHHCQMTLPPGSPFSFMQFSNHFAVDSDGPSSYEVLASQTRCPSGLNVQEFTAYQTLFSGKSRRWPQMLIELASSNLNFSSEATALLMVQLALQAGPFHKSDPLRTVHRIFRDEFFCKRLLEQINQRLDDISSNWREINCMQMLITLILKMCSIGPELVIGEALKVLERIRAATFKWTSQLRSEIHRSTDASTSQRCSRYAFWAALLCRKTFTQYIWDVDTTPNQDRHFAALQCFIECSITLQDNLFGDPAALPVPARNALIADLKMTHRIRFVLLRSLMASTKSLDSAIDNVWPQSEGQIARSYSPLVSLEHPKDWWVESTIRATERNQQQTIHYHLLGGHLLVDGQPIGKLPAKHRESFVLEQLFGRQSLLTYPSGRPGMSYVVAFPINGHQIHLGFRNKVLIVQAYTYDTVLEFVPPNVFGDESNFDLPASLVENCVHWLDLRRGVLEVRQRPAIWNFKPSNWRLDLNTRKAERKNSALVDPHSRLFRQVSLIFDYFEYGSRLTVFQPGRGTLSVELRRLELSFFVKRMGPLQGLLECRQLKSVIDRDQDAYTWYGLRSKLVLRDTVNPRQRSIIVPLGSVKCNRNQFHVEVKVENNGRYGRFIINDVLGRLECPTEPLLLYWKARLHALTSFVVPDPLTGRTGTEEALHCLKSSYCHPWTPLNPGPFEILRLIANFTPRRDYYPKDIKKMQHVTWDHDLTTTIQHDGYRPIVEAICEKSKKLSVFALENAERPSLQFGPDSAHLLHRSYLRRCLYERPDPDCGQQKAADLPYHARDRRQLSQKCGNVFESATLIRNWPSEMPQVPALAGILLNWPTIAGYDRSFDRFLLSDLIDVRFASEWGPLVNLCRASDSKEKYQLMFLFAVISFREDAEMDVIRTLIAFAVFEDLKALDPPKWQSYSHFRPNHIPSVDYLVQLVKNCCVPYPDDERSIFQGSLGSKFRRKLEAAERAHEQQTESDCKAFAQFILDQWPCSEPVIEGCPPPLLLDVPRALKIISSEYLRLYQNMQLSQYIAQVQPILDLHCIGSKIELPISGSVDQDVILTRQRGGELATLSQNLLQKTGPTLSGKLQSMISNVGRWKLGGENGHHVDFASQKENFRDRFREPTETKCTVSPVTREIQELDSIINGILDSESTVQQQYGRDMKLSLEALKDLGSAPKQAKETIIPETLRQKISMAKEQVQDSLRQLCMAFEQQDLCAQWLKEGGLWPCITPVTLLEQLRSTSRTEFGCRMKESLIEYGVSVTVLQRLLRIEDAHQRGDMQRLHEELVNPGHGNWQPLKKPDWLLLEIDGNILIRHDQVEVADATIAPASGSNSVLQMNMGQGKTSCIMPMVAAMLADTKQLMRVIIPKSLLLQTAQLLQARLGGLLGREVRHVPFSRKTPTSSATIKAFFNLHKEVMASSGVIVALPEHILSFMLSGLQRLSDVRIAEASQMVKVQAWIRQFSRDVLDESDFTLAVRTQLIYPSGSQMTVDGHPHRWWVAETLLRLIDGHLWNLQQDFPRSIEVVRRSQGGFPYVFFLSKDVEDELIARLVKDVLRGLVSIIPIRECNPSDRVAIKHFISDANIRPAFAEHIRGIFPDKRAARQAIYLLRGLLVHRILLLTLKKRWNVQYGLHPSRDPIAVPFHAKGVPSEQAEWGHPDVAILFTCLAFYYGGLKFAQLRQSLEHLLKSDDPSNEYDRWNYSSKSLPDSLREWNVINVDDEAQLMEIWQHLRYEVVVIDYFLNHFVFPKHAKQFRMKLQASGWDIPLSSNATQSVKKHPKSLTTGFSGTNDNRFLLPLTIKQADLCGLSHTNAEVLTYLLQPRNRGYVLAADNRGRHIGELDLLQKLRSKGIRMLIDAGAQILEMDNISLAKAWLTIDYEAPAAVYFNTENKAFVIYRHGLQIPLSASPFAENLGECLVYLDEAHTRGTDLKMPANARGALTLGLGQTKDQTVQAAMRLRQLATSQSVVFFAPPEVHQSILDLRRKGLHDSVDSYDVICWLLQQTCSGIEQLQPLYFSHGSDFCRRQQAALENPDFLVDVAQRDAYLHEVRQTEQQTLTQLYGPRLKSKSAKNFKASSPQVAAFMKELNVRRKGFQDTGNAVHGSALQEVEQEREVAFEVEAVREVEKPVHYSPLSFSGLHKDIVSFMKTGRLAAGDGGYEHVSVALRRTGLGLKHGINSEAAVSKLFVSKEFMRSVSIPLERTNDNFLRQVNWILWSVVTNTALIIIPEEAELCLPLVRDFQEPFTHLLTYAAPVTRKMLHFNNLTFYAVPSLPTGWKPPTSLTIELGIFAGRLYFEYDEYSDMRNYLGCGEDNSTKVDEPLEDPTPAITKLHEQDVDEAPDSLEEVGRQTATSSGQQARRSFTAKPLTFLQEWLAMRRKGQDFTHTPMGYVCQGKPLAANHPFFNKRVDNAGDAGSGSITANGAGSGQGKQSVWKGNIGTAADADTHADPSVSSDLDYPDEEDYFIQDEDGEQEDGMYEESDRSERSESDEKSLEESDGKGLEESDEKSLEESVEKSPEESDEESPVDDDEEDSYGSSGPQQWPSPHRSMV